jgi:hypothetical protein
MSKTAANSKKTAKPRGKPWQPGQSGNPTGRPKDGESWAAIIAAVGNMYPDDILEFIGRNNDLGREIAKFPKDVQMKYLVTARIFAALMFDPNPRMWTGLMDRAEGKPNQPISGADGDPLKVIIEYADAKSNPPLPSPKADTGEE